MPPSREKGGHGGTAHSLARVIAAHVDEQRVFDRLDALASIGATAGGGITRLAFSDEERMATDLVVSWMREARLTVAFDEFGNVFGSTDANASRAAVSMCGSHLDTVPNGGRFDGALGVVAAIESVLAMQSTLLLPPLPLELVVWRCEEPVRFSQGKVGSLLFSNQIAREDLRPVENPPLDLDAALRRDGPRPQRAVDRRIVTALELHIEQGRRLERAGQQIGVVTAVAAPIRLQLSVRGSADHSGATPMSERRDALCAAAELVLAIERAAHTEAEHESVATSANITCRPGTMNVIPGEAIILVDVRGIDAPSMNRLVETIEASGVDVAARRSIEIRCEVLSRGTPTQFGSQMVTELVDTVAALGYEPALLPSGAGHDVQCLAGLADIGMLFVPSVGGISHAPEEYTKPEDVIAGTRALAACWWTVAGEE
jgi:beta-ureidopropionase / N-carbamoyl-L-amino-acid hydrolase